MLSDPERSARYDVVYHRGQSGPVAARRGRSHAENDFEMEQDRAAERCLEALYTRRRIEPTMPSLMMSELNTHRTAARALDFTVSTWRRGSS